MQVAPFARVAHDLLNQVRNIRLFRLEDQFAGFEARNVQQLANEPRQFVCLTGDRVQRALYPFRLELTRSGEPTQRQLRMARQGGDRRLQFMRGRRQKLIARAHRGFGSRRSMSIGAAA